MPKATSSSASPVGGSSRRPSLGSLPEDRTPPMGTLAEEGSEEGSEESDDFEDLSEDEDEEDEEEEDHNDDAGEPQVGAPWAGGAGADSRAPPAPPAFSDNPSREAAAPPARQRPPALAQDEPAEPQHHHVLVGTTAEPASREGPACVPGQEIRQRTIDQQHLCAVLAERGGGSMLRGWRQYLDPDGVLEVKFEPFCSAAAKLNWKGDVRLLMGGDQDCSSMTLEELSPDAALLIKRFKRFVKAQYGSTAELFKACDKLACGQASREEFVSAAVERGWPGTARELRDLFDMCDVDHIEVIKSDSLVFLEEDDEIRDDLLAKSRLSSLQEWRYKVAQEYMERQRHPESNVHHRLAPRPWQAKTFEKLPHVACKMRYDRRREDLKKQRFAKQEFQKYVEQTWGNEIRFLRRVMESRERKVHTYVLSQAQLRNHMGKANLDRTLDTRALWKSLDQDDDLLVRVEELAPVRSQVLARFQLWCRENPSLRKCTAIWDTAEAKAARGRKRPGNINSATKMKYTAVVETLKQLGWPLASDKDPARLLLTSIDLSGCGFITRADLEWLDGWHGSDWLYADPDSEAWEQLRIMLTQKYNHLLRAWRMLLDKDSSNKLSWLEFRDACRQIRFDGNVAGAWRHLDEDMSGFISMREYDRASAELLSSFKQWAESSFGSVALCFKALDDDRSGLVTLTELRRACHKMNWKGDVKLLFQCLDADQTADKTTGKRSIELAEICFLDSWIPEPAMEEFEIPKLSPRRQSGPASPKRDSRLSARLDSRLSARPSRASISADARDALAASAAEVGHGALASKSPPASPFSAGQAAAADRRPGTAPRMQSPPSPAARAALAGPRPASQGTVRRSLKESLDARMDLQPPRYLQRVGISCTTPSRPSADVQTMAHSASLPSGLQQRQPHGQAVGRAGSAGCTRSQSRPQWDASQPVVLQRSSPSARAALRGNPGALDPTPPSGKAAGPVTAAYGAAALTAGVGPLAARPQPRSGGGPGKPSGNNLNFRASPGPRPNTRSKRGSAAGGRGLSRSGVMPCFALHSLDADRPPDLSGSRLALLST